MTSWGRAFLVLLKKELLLEARGKELLTLLLCSSLMIAILVGSGVSSAVLDAHTTRKLYPMLLWIVFLLTATTASVRVSEAELEGRGFEGLFLAGVTGPQLYMAKVCVATLLFFLDWVLLVLLLGLALDQRISEVLPTLLKIGLGSSIALAALIVLLSAVTGTSRLRGVLLPLVTIPLLFPLFFAGVEMTTACLLYGALESGSIWPSIVLLSATVFVLVGINTYELALRE
jgi:ABC-type transport system involved in cytochrome c biogenesis permease component